MQSSASSGNTPQGERSAVVQAADAKILSWVSSLTGSEEINQLAGAAAAERLREWWFSGARERYGSLAKKLTDLPEPVMGVPLHNMIQSFLNRLNTLSALFARQSESGISLGDAMSQASTLFGGDLEVAAAWPRSVENMACFTRWLSGIMPELEYVGLAFPSGVAEIDRLRSALLENMEHPQRWLHAADREAFDRSFLEFKARYKERYASRHDETVGSDWSIEGSSEGIDSSALRNLEMLMRLAHTDRSLLGRVRTVVTWRRDHRCPLPVRKILDAYPRCYCNFNPAANPGLQTSAPEINKLIHHGIEQIRTALRRHSAAIIAELKACAAAEAESKQIAALLSHGPAAALRPRTVEILNSIVSNLPGWFQNAPPGA